MTRILDWRSRHDEESKKYPVRAVVGKKVVVKDTLWKPGAVLDQGQEGACVGFGWTGELLAEPMPNKTGSAAGSKYAQALYNYAKTIDEFEGVDYDGTSVLAGAKALKKRNFMGGYHWAFSVEDVRDALVTTGPVVIGIPWFESMYETRPDGLVEVSGNNVGGHCILLTGYFQKKVFGGKPVEVVQWRNSWGDEYGIHGDAWVKLEDLATLLKDDGEACLPVDRKPVKL